MGSIVLTSAHRQPRRRPSASMAAEASVGASPRSVTCDFRTRRRRCAFPRRIRRRLDSINPIACREMPDRWATSVWVSPSRRLAPNRYSPACAGRQSRLPPSVVRISDASCARFRTPRNPTCRWYCTKSSRPRTVTCQYSSPRCAVPTARFLERVRLATIPSRSRAYPTSLASRVLLVVAHTAAPRCSTQPSPSKYPASKRPSRASSRFAQNSGRCFPPAVLPHWTRRNSVTARDPKPRSIGPFSKNGIPAATRRSRVKPIDSGPGVIVANRAPTWPSATKRPKKPSQSPVRGTLAGSPCGPWRATTLVDPCRSSTTTPLRPIAPRGARSPRASNHLAFVSTSRPRAAGPFT